MKELKKLKLSTFTYELKKKELGQIVGGGKQNTDTYGHTTSHLNQTKILHLEIGMTKPCLWNCENISL